MDNFTAIRNGLLDHALTGKLSPFDFGLYVFLIMRADYSTGIYRGCALTIAWQFGDPSQKRHIQKSLRRLRDKKFLNYRNGDGRRGAYSILINKFSVTVGELSGTRLNAWKHNGLATPEYEPENGHGTVVAQSRNSGGTVVAPNKDLKTKDVKDLEDKGKPGAPKNGASFSEQNLSSKRKRKPQTQLPDNFRLTDDLRTWAAVKGYDRLEERLEHFKGWAKAKGATYADWNQAFQNSVRDDWAKLNHRSGGNGTTNRAEIIQAGIVQAVRDAKAANR